MPLHVNQYGVRKKARFAATRGAVGLDDASDPDKLKLLLASVMSRLQELERKSPPECVDFEMVCGASGNINMEHGMNCPVRWYVIDWKASSGGPNLRMDETNSTLNKLSLVSGAAGKAVIRIEPSPYELTAGTT